MLVHLVLAPLVLGAAVVALPLPSRSLPPRQPTAAELQRAIERLTVVGSVLYVAAHPDDENTRLLGWLANEKLLRTAYLAITRGDGGQNLIGSEQGPLLGLIRTQELLAARRIDGAEQLFTRALDFGYSKTPEETLAIWGKDDVLADVVWAIRRFQPDVVITRFSTEAGETHGHHTASARLAGEAFRAAADPTIHPEQLAFVRPWAARRLLWNKALFLSKPGEDLSGYLHTDVGGYNPALGLSYGELAADSRSMHKSQGFGAPRTRGEALEYFQALDGDKPTGGDFLGGIDFSWNRVPGAQKVSQALERARRDFRVERPDSAVPALLDAYAAVELLPDGDWKQYSHRALAEVIAGCMGLTLDAVAAEPAAVPGVPLPVKISAFDRSNTPATWVEVSVGGQRVPVGKPLSGVRPVEVSSSVTPAEGAAPSSPYWLENAARPGLFTVADPARIGLPENPAAFEVEAVVEVLGRQLRLTRPVLFQWVDQVAGQKSRAVEVTAPVLVKPATPTLLFPDGKPRELAVSVEAGAAHLAGTVRLELPPNWHAEPASQPFALEGKGDSLTVRFRVSPPAGKARFTDTVRIFADVGSKSYGRGITRIDHSHIPLQTLFPEATVKTVRFDLKRASTRVGYLMGAGDEVPAALQQAGYEVTLLDDERLRNEPLAAYDAIVVGVRAYNTRPLLAAQHQKLMDWVAAGGTLLVQYNTNNRLSALTQPIGPFPFQVSQDRVTDETAAVTFTDPVNPLLTSPNHLTQADFDGWIQERGLYFAGQWDPRYATPLSMHDPNEPARLGSLLVARHGKGTFIYTGLAFFRQLPAGVPGAFRLFANLIAHGNR